MRQRSCFKTLKTGIMAQAFNPSTLEAEAGGSLSLRPTVLSPQPTKYITFQNSYSLGILDNTLYSSYCKKNYLKSKAKISSSFDVSICIFVSLSVYVKYFAGNFFHILHMKKEKGKVSFKAPSSYSQKVSR